MNTFSPRFLLGAFSALGAFGALSTAPGSAAAVDTSQWKCETCPFEKGASGAVELGVGAVSQASARFGDYTGLDRKGGFAIIGGEARYRGDDGLYGRASASDLGLDVRALAAEVGREGRYALKLGVDEVPRHLTDTASTPFLGSGGNRLTLPAGFPAPTTAAMPLAGTLQGAELGTRRTRISLAASALAGDAWTYRISLRHEVRDGTERSAGSFFANAAQLVAPVNQVTDQLEVSAAYASRRWQATLAYHASMFRNRDDALTWTNPFTNNQFPNGRGQLALAPDNQFHQIMASVGYEISPRVRASAEIAFGRMTQDAAYLAATLNPALVVPALPAQSLGGRANTVNASLKLTAAPTERLRLAATYTRDERDNQTASRAYPAVSTDLFIGIAPCVNQPYSFTQDRLKLAADYRGPGSLKAGVGAELDHRHRTLQEVGTTREATYWGRVSAAPVETVSLALKLAHADRRQSEYNPVAAIDPPENPLLRKYNLANRVRDSASLRADIALGEKVTIGLNVDYANDDYADSVIGLTDGKSLGFGADASFAMTERTQLHVYAQGERIRSRQAGSQVFAQPDWSARTRDTVDVVGLGITHAAIKDKLDIGADLAFSRSRSDVTVTTGAALPSFPSASTTLDSLKLHATWRLKENLTLAGSFWHERYDAQDWHLDGVLPATVPNLLAFGEQPPRYRVNVLRVALRYRF